jgi:hypothetical protein
MSTVDELIAFLKARLDEAEAVAKAAQAPSPWKAATHESDHWIVTDAAGEPLIYDEGTPSLEEAAHIALHDPDRELRVVAAKRAILARHFPIKWDGEHIACAWCSDDIEAGPGLPWPCPDVRDLAAVDSGHPGYRKEWAP